MPDTDTQTATTPDATAPSPAEVVQWVKDQQARLDAGQPLSKQGIPPGYAIHGGHIVPKTWWDQYGAAVIAGAIVLTGGLAASAVAGGAAASSTALATGTPAISSEAAIAAPGALVATSTVPATGALVTGGTGLATTAEVAAPAIAATAAPVAATAGPSLATTAEVATPAATAATQVPTGGETPAPTTTPESTVPGDGLPNNSSGQPSWLTRNGPQLATTALTTSAQLYAAKIQSDAQKESAQLQAQATANALAFEKTRYADLMGRLQPYVASGTTATDRMSQLLGLPPRAATTAAAWPGPAGPTGTPTPAPNAFQNQAGASPAASTVKMRAPDGSTQDVNPQDVAHYTQLGAVVLQ